MSEAATAPSAQPDIKLVLDMKGVIQEATLANGVPDQDLDSWIGRPWLETVGSPGGDKIERILSDARNTGVSAFRQVNQRFPSGLELPIEYTAVRQGRGCVVAVGKSLQAVADLQSRLIAAQQAMERDYWKLREAETRCRVLFDTSNDAVLLVRAENLRIVEANPAATRALGLTLPLSEDGDFLAQVASEERASLGAMLQRVRDQGKAPGILIPLGPERKAWLVRASLLTSRDGLVYLLQLAPAEPGQALEVDDGLPLATLVERAPDAFVVLDAGGRILRANRAFLDLVELGDETSVRGEQLARWLGRPGADMAVLLSNVARHGVVRLFSTTLHGELGAAAEVEVAAAGDLAEDPDCIGVSIRDVGSRLPVSADAEDLGSALARLADRIGKTSLRSLVKETVGLVERHYVEAALELTAGNRTAAAQLLGLSRQSLYAKLNRYGLDRDATAAGQGV